MESRIPPVNGPSTKFAWGTKSPPPFISSVRFWSNPIQASDGLLLIAVHAKLIAALFPVIVIVAGTAVPKVQFCPVGSPVVDTTPAVKLPAVLVCTTKARYSNPPQLSPKSPSVSMEALQVPREFFAHVSAVCTSKVHA